eukprot:6297960-Pyramimonas_sp.AAC.1
MCKNPTSPCCASSTAIKEPRYRPTSEADNSTLSAASSKGARRAHICSTRYSSKSSGASNQPGHGRVSAYNWEVPRRRA